MVDREKEMNRIQIALDGLRGIQEALVVLHEGGGLAQIDPQRSNAMTTLIHLLGDKIDDAEYSTYAMEFGKFCTDDPRHRSELNS